MTGLKIQMCKGREGGRMEDRTKRKVEKARKGMKDRWDRQKEEAVTTKLDLILCGFIHKSALTS